MAKRPTKAAPAAKLRSRGSGPLSLRVRFLKTSIGKRIQEVNEPPPPQTEVMMKELIDAFLRGFEKGKWCAKVESDLDSATDFLREEWDNLPKEDRDSLEKDCAELLGLYSERC